MVSLTIRFRVRPEWSDRWMGMVSEFTQAMREERGNLWYIWARNVEDPSEFFLIEAWREDLVEEHLASPLIPKITREWPEALLETPQRLMSTLPGNDWSVLERMPVPARLEA